MCGISGFNWKDEEKVAKMVGTLSHRGPDATGVYVDEGISLGHNRLSIIDLDKRANQPMFSDDDNLVIVYNGEIYNFRELKKELSDYAFKTESDTEVILAGYKKWGRGVAKKLNGMFAFAIWDKHTKELFIARDHAGIKPLYYFWDGQRFIFASEVKAILEHDIPRRINREALNHYLRILYSPAPMTMFDKIFKLPPAHYMSVKSGVLEIFSYEEMVENQHLSYKDATIQLKDKVTASVKRQMISDVPIGAYLSGGIDSSTVLYAMSQLSHKVKTFSMGFELTDEEEKDKFNQDFVLAEETAKFFGAEHHPITISSKDVLGAFEKYSTQNDEPISHPTAIPMMLLARYAKQEVSVVLTGNGGDELFGGYDRYKKSLVARMVYERPDLFAKFMFIKDDKLSQLLSSPVLLQGEKIKTYYEKYLTGLDVADALMNTDKKSWLPDYFFALSDRMSMRSALEERMPLCDKELWEFSASLPRKYKLDYFKSKKILKDAFRSDLPEYLFNQPKRGWFAPGAKWLRRPEFASLAKEVLSRDYHSGTADLFIWDSVERMLDDHIGKKTYNLTSIWAILTFQIWAKKYNVTL